MKRKEFLRLSNRYCQNATMFVVALLFVFGLTFSTQFVLAQEAGDVEPVNIVEETSSEEIPVEESTEVEIPVPEVVEENLDEALDAFVIELDTEETVVDVKLENATSSEEDGLQSFVADFISLVTLDIVETPRAVILTPSPSETVYGSYTFTAEYFNPDYEGNPGVRWAIRADGVCSGDVPGVVPVFGNVDGAATSPAHSVGVFDNGVVSWDGSLFEATLDFTGLDAGEYCFAFNPNPANSYRQTVVFNYEIPGSIVVNKTLLGLDEEISDETEFTIEIDGEEIDGMSDSMTEGGSVVFSGLPAGEYTVVETDIPAGYRFASVNSGDIAYTENSITVTVLSGATTTVNIMNRFAECNDGFDNDRDGSVDLEDGGCENSDDDREYVPMCFASEFMLNGDETMTITEGSEFVDLGVTITEGESESYIISSKDEVDVNVPGTYTLRYYIYDRCKNEITITRTVIVEEKSSGRRSGSHRHLTTGSVLGAFTGGTNNSGGSCGMYLNSYMKMGGQNNEAEVRKLQSFLNEQGYIVLVDGFFGASTDSAVREFQKKHAGEILAPWGITDPTGYVFKMTRYIMNNMVCAGSEAKPVL